LFGWCDAGPEFEPKHHHGGNREQGDCSASKNGLNNSPVPVSTKASVSGDMIRTVAHLEISFSAPLLEKIYTHK
jgi:hypothetical protein